MSRETQHMWRLAARYMSVGMEMAAELAIGTLGGKLLDDWLGTTPVLFWFGLVVGIGAMVKTVLRVVKTTHLGDL